MNEDVGMIATCSEKLVGLEAAGRTYEETACQFAEGLDGRFESGTSSGR